MQNNNLRIGSVELKSNVILAPMAGLTDTIFRKLIRKYSKTCLLTTEMLSSEAIVNNPKGNILKYEEEELPLSFQIAGHKPHIMAKAAKYVEQFATIIDINMGCPVNKIVKGSDGAGLMKTPDLAVDIVKAVKDSVNVPVTVKTRLGWDSTSINFVEFSKKMEEAGADAIMIHGRTRSQMYGGKADWEIISQLKNEIKIPFIANGDITTPEMAKTCMELAQCDGIAIGRGAIGNPDLFFRTEKYLEEGVLLPSLTLAEKIDNLIEHLEGEMKLRRELIGIKFMRKFYAYYISAFKHASHIRQKLITSEDIKEIMYYLTAIKENNF